MIPENIDRKQVIKAIEEVKRTGIPKRRKSKKFLMKFEDSYFPPKYVISLANKYANGEELNPEGFSGGSESNDFLRALGFEILEKKFSKENCTAPRYELRKTTSSKVHHNERCPKCKQTIEKLLEKIYGKVERNYKFEVGTHPDDYLNSAGYDKLKEIYDALKNCRGFGEFVKAATLPNCDFFIPNPGFMVEFDESQHFTLPRKIALERYPNDLRLGFNRAKWIASCDRINAQDNNPPYRDEQRAWYDTLRDFLPAVKGLKPTVRLLARDFVWCNLNPEYASDVERFKEFIKNASDHWKIEVKGKEEPNPFFSRIIIADEWDGNPSKAKALLEDVCEKWPKGQKVKFLVTCGGFVQFDWPKSMSRMDVGDNKNPNEEAVNALVAEAENCAKLVLGEGLSDKLRQFTDYVTLGIDSSKEKISTTQNYIGKLHVELVFLIDLRNNEFYWTGKSYPTSGQQNGLVRITKLEKHFFDLDIGNVMILGCHDLAIFNPRSKNAKYWREQTNRDFKQLATTKEPVCVLHHPHTTVIRKTWLTSWNFLIKKLPSVEQYAGAGRYHEPNRERSKWDTLDNVLDSTKCGRSIDFVVCK
ncbi:MAG: hypothetical protein ABSB10_09645 [Candidatus Bathyarchaeia archaeon]|jgi:hypothetical protein